MLTKAEMPVPASGHEPGVVNSTVYAGGQKVADVAIEEAGEWSKRPGHVVWIGLVEPNDDLLQPVQRQFDLHPLAIEDAANAHQYPKLEQYGESIFIVARTAQMVDGRIAFGETHLFVGHGYVVSVRHGASVSYAAVRQRCEACPTVLIQGEDYIVYAILDFIVDNYIPVLDHDVDPLIEIILRFSKAVADGAARENLKFLAQVIAGLKKHKALQGDQFRRWCAILEHLTRDELLVVGLSQVIKKQIDAGGPNAANDFWQRLEPALEKAGYEKGEIAALSASVSRTGLLTPVSAFGGMVYMPTPWLDQLGALADLESATRTQPKHAADKR